MNDRNSTMKYTVRIHTDYVIQDPQKVEQILERVSKIITNSYKRIQQEGGSVRA